MYTNVFVPSDTSHFAARYVPDHVEWPRGSIVERGPRCSKAPVLVVPSLLCRPSWHGATFSRVRHIGASCGGVNTERSEPCGATMECEDL